MERVIPKSMLRKLTRKRALPLDPENPIAIKRDVHEFVISADAEQVAHAFRDVVTDPKSQFGLIRVKRPESRMGAGFEVGERFQGCFSVETVMKQAAARLQPLNASSVVEWLLRRPTTGQVISWIEDSFLSNYAEICEINISPDLAAGECYLLKYRYLDGTPIAGSSTFRIEPLDDHRCRVLQIFEFQEVNAMALATFQRFGLKMHDQVVFAQIHQAAARIGARVLSATIPSQYGELLETVH